MGLSQELLSEIEKGKLGKNNIIPIPYERLGEYIDISRNTNYVIGGESGSAKSTLVHDMFILNPLLWYEKNKNPDIKLSIIFFGMERKQYSYSARWLSRLIFQEQGVEIHPKKILGRRENYRMTEYEEGLVREYSKRLDEWEKDDLLITHEGSKNPSGISMYLERFAEKHGTIIKKDKTDKSTDNILATKKYIPNHLNHIVLIIIDHIAILSPEKDDKTKSKIDRFSTIMREARDVYGFSPVIVQQLNRNLSDVTRLKLGDLTPKLSDFADSSQTIHDADVVMALFDPFRHIHGELTGKDLDNGFSLIKLRDKSFRTYYRTLHILKNSFEASSMHFPMALQPIYGILKTMPRKSDLKDDSVYDNILTGNYFLN